MKKTEKTVNAVSWVAGITAIAAAMLLAVLLLLSLAGRIHPRKQALHLYTPDIAQVYDETALTVSSLHEGEYGISDVCLSSLSLVDDKGVRSIITQTLSDEELKKLHESAEALKAVIRSANV